MLDQKAPEFSLEASTGHAITLQDLRGSFVVLIFYPANDTPTCNTQLDEMSINQQEFLDRNARVFGVNTANASKHAEYCTRKRLEFPILSDPKGETAKRYKAFWGWLNVNKRTVAVIDPEGVICFYERGKPDPSKVVKSIDERAKLLKKA